MQSLLRIPLNSYNILLNIINLKKYTFFKSIHNIVVRAGRSLLSCLWPQGSLFWLDGRGGRSISCHRPHHLFCGEHHPARRGNRGLKTDGGPGIHFYLIIQQNYNLAEENSLCAYASTLSIFVNEDIFKNVFKRNFIENFFVEFMMNEFFFYKT